MEETNVIDYKGIHVLITGKGCKQHYKVPLPIMSVTVQHGIRIVNYNLDYNYVVQASW